MRARPGRHLGLAALLLLAAGARSPLGAALRVPSQFPSIQAAVDAAGDGDTIVVEGGVYPEDVLITGKDLYLLGEKGKSATSVRSLTFRADFPSDLISGEVTGFTLTGDLAAGEVLEFRVNGCATLGDVTIWSSAPVNAEVRVASCEIHSGISVLNRGATTVSRCRILGGTVWLGAGDGYLSRCDLSGSSVTLDTPTVASISGCHLQETPVDISAWGVGIATDNDLTSGDLTVSLTQAAYAAADLGGNRVRSGGIVIRGTMFNRMNVHSNTVYGAEGDGIRIDGGASPLIELRNNLVVMCRRGIVSVTRPKSADIGCNDVWGNPDGNWTGIDDPTGIDGNFSLDPRFCNPDAGSLMLAGDSPCLPGLNGDCGLIGALGLGCTGTAATDYAGSVFDAGRPSLSIPNPYPAGAAIVLAEPAPARFGESAATVYDCLGRRVRSLLRESPPAAERTFSWDGRDDRGARVATGIYHLEVTAGSERITRKFLLQH